MRLDHEFAVAVETAELWRAMTDIRRLASCLPGAQLETDASDPYRGTVSARIGALSVKFAGELRVVQRDDAQRRLVLACHGREVRGGSGAQAEIDFTVSEDPHGDGVGSRVALVTTMELSGKVAQFGLGMLTDVSNAIMQAFVANLEQELGVAGSSAQASAAPRASSSDSTPDRAAPASGHAPGTGSSAPLDLGSIALPMMWQRYGPTVLSGAALLLAWAAWRRARPPARGWDHARMPHRSPWD